MVEAIKKKKKKEYPCRVLGSIMTSACFHLDEKYSNLEHQLNVRYICHNSTLPGKKGRKRHYNFIGEPKYNNLAFMLMIFFYFLTYPV